MFYMRLDGFEGRGLQKIGRIRKKRPGNNAKKMHVCFVIFMLKKSRFFKNRTQVRRRCLRLCPVSALHRWARDRMRGRRCKAGFRIRRRGFVIRGAITGRFPLAAISALQR